MGLGPNQSHPTHSENVFDSLTLNRQGQVDDDVAESHRAPLYPTAIDGSELQNDSKDLTFHIIE